MVKRKNEKPFVKIFVVRTKLQLYQEYGEEALDVPLAEFMADVNEAYAMLIDFRNIINGMVSFQEPPTVAVLPYLPSE